MNITELNILFVFFLMGLVIYINRIIGYWIASRIKINKAIETWLNFLPGCILMSLVAPSIFTSDWRDFIASGLLVIVMLLTDSLLFAMITGIGAVALLRLLI